MGQYYVVKNKLDDTLEELSILREFCESQRNIISNYQGWHANHLRKQYEEQTIIE